MSEDRSKGPGLRPDGGGTNPAQRLGDDRAAGALAPVIVDRIVDVMVEMNRRGKAVLLAEQNVAVALEAASRAYVIDTG